MPKPRDHRLLRLQRTALAAIVFATVGVGLAQDAGVASGAPFAAALVVGLAAIGAGIAVGIAGAAAIGAIAEKPELLGRTLIFVGLAEGIVIYGLIIAFIILGGG
jgi:V/A-type H+/Na+-transporting ATPase subunit K